MLTQADLKKQLHYDFETGIFTRLISSNDNIKIGDIAGGNSGGYIRLMVLNKRYLAHRLAYLYMTGDWPKTSDIDHANRITNDNRWCNLRSATRTQNQLNKPIQKSSKSVFKGVYICNGKWRASCSLNKKSYHLGYFETAELAAFAYENFAKYNHGEFYNKNITA